MIRRSLVAASLLLASPAAADGWYAATSSGGADVKGEMGRHYSDAINLRRSAGFSGKPANDVIYEIPAAAALTILSGPSAADGLSWWGVRYVSPAGNRFDGWAAEASASGSALLTIGRIPTIAGLFVSATECSPTIRRSLRRTSATGDR